MTDHEHYAILCTLAATGQLDALEEIEFDEHRMHCFVCRERVQDLHSIGAQLILNAALQSTSSSMPAGSLERFRARAIREGIAAPAALARPFASYARASVAAVFVMIASLFLVPHGRKAAEGSAVAREVPVTSRPSLAASVNREMPITSPSKVVAERFVRHRKTRITAAEVSDASLTAQSFPMMIGYSYPYFEPEIATRIKGPNYPALSGSQISRLSLFRSLSESAGRDAVGAAPHTRPVDIASTGSVFDFTAQIRQLHFQLPTAQ
jgi:hypothetical protein